MRRLLSPSIASKRSRHLLVWPPLQRLDEPDPVLFLLYFRFVQRGLLCTHRSSEHRLDLRCFLSSTSSSSNLSTDA